MKLFTYCFLLFILIGCGSAPTKQPPRLTFYYSHPDHGVVSIPNEYHKAARNECKSKVYSEGVMIDGVKTMDHKLIDRYVVESIMHDTSAARARLKDSADSLKNFSGAAATYGAYDNEKGKQYTVPDDGGKYDEVDRVESEISACMESKGWVEVKQGEQ